MRKSTSVDTMAQQDTAGALEFSDNLATNCGYAALIGGGLLATAIGTAVAPAPTLGLMTVGAGTICASNYKSIKAHFTGDDAKADTQEATAPAAA